MSDICGLCHGQQFLFFRQDDKNCWRSCPNCNGVGTVRCHAAPTIRLHRRKTKDAKKMARIDREMQRFFQPKKDGDEWVTL
jgi:hypothetical protein